MLDFHPDPCLFLRSQLLKHFREGHKVILIAVLWFWSVCLYTFVTFRGVHLCTPLHFPPSVTFA